jgi:hypothetical protein
MAPDTSTLSLHASLISTKRQQVFIANLPLSCFVRRSDTRQDPQHRAPRAPTRLIRSTHTFICSDAPLIPPLFTRSSKQHLSYPYLSTNAIPSGLSRHNPPNISTPASVILPLPSILGHSAANRSTISHYLRYYDISHCYRPHINTIPQTSHPTRPVVFNSGPRPLTDSSPPCYRHGQTIALATNRGRKDCN